jgi:hypothetical protein
MVSVTIERETLVFASEGGVMKGTGSPGQPAGRPDKCWRVGFF